MIVYRVLPLIILMAFSFPSFAQKKRQAISLQWKIAGELPAINGQKKSLGLAGPIVGVSNDALILGGGANFPDTMPWLGGKKKYYDDVYVFKKTKNGHIKSRGLFKLPYPVAYSASCSTPNGIVSVGGENESGICGKVLLIKWAGKIKGLVFENLPDLPYEVTNAAASSNGNKIYLAGGERSCGVSGVFLVLDLDHVEDGWTELPPLPKALSYAVMSIQSNGRDQCVYLMGGRRKSKEQLSDFYSGVFQFNLTTNQWTEKQSLPFGLSAGTGVAAGPNLIFLFGGDKGETFHRVEALILASSQEKDEEKKKQLNQQRIAIQSSHPGFSKEVLVYNTITDVWKICGSIPFNAPATTTSVRWGNWVFVPNGEIRAGVRTPDILAVKIQTDKQNY